MDLILLLRQNIDICINVLFTSVQILLRAHPLTQMNRNIRQCLNSAPTKKRHLEEILLNKLVNNNCDIIKQNHLFKCQPAKGADGSVMKIIYLAHMKTIAH